MVADFCRQKTHPQFAPPQRQSSPLKGTAILSRIVALTPLAAQGRNRLHRLQGAEIEAVYQAMVGKFVVGLQSQRIGVGRRRCRQIPLVLEHHPQVIGR